MAIGPNQSAQRERRLPPSVAAMTRPEFYPERPERLEFIQTHISYVFLTDQHVYKVKKAVRFPFLDASTLARRRHLCHEEIRLNRRLAPAIYLGVVPILATGDGFALGDESHGAETNAVEYAVRMRRMPRERMLDRMVERHEATPQDVRIIASRIADFHQRAEALKSWTYGSAAAVHRMICGNLAEAEQFAGAPLDAGEIAAIDAYNRGFIEANWELLNRRAHSGRVREGHGDLRCEHICLDGPPVVFDCVEFSERLRYGDVASELAFLAMDLERLAAPGLAEELTEAYVAASGDLELRALLPFYKCYRAVVRAKVDCLRSLEPEVPEAERAQARDSARDYLALARRSLERVEPAMIVIFGLSGSGKSALARMLSVRLGFDLLSSDVIRKQLAGMPPTSRAAAGYGEGIYSEGFTRRTYLTLIAEAEARLRKGRGVILDATFRRASERRLAIEAAARAGVHVLFVECRVPSEVALARIAERERRAGEVSDASAETYARQLREFEAPVEIAQEARLIFDTTTALEPAAAAVIKALAEPRKPVTQNSNGRRSNLRQLLDRL